MSTSPYAAPKDLVSLQPPYLPPTSGRPTGVTVFAVLNIMFGIMGLLGTIVSVAFLFIGGNFNLGPNPTLDALDNSPLYHAFMIGSMFLGLIFCIVLIVSGVGLLKMSQTARKLAIAYAIYAIISSIIVNIVNVFVVILPMLDKAGGAGSPQAVVIGTVVGTVFGGMVGLIFPIATLIYFLRPRIRETFRTWAS